MGNHKFRLSAMIPNAWFYKLRDMSITKLRNHSSQTNTTSHPTIKNKSSSSPSKKPSKPSIVHHESIIRKDNKLICTSSKNPIKSSAETRLLRYDSSPRKSTNKLKRAKRKTIYMPSPRKVAPSLSSGYVFHEPGNPVWLKPGNVRFQEKISMFPCNNNNNNGDPSSSSSPDHGFFESLSSESQKSDSFDIHCKNEMIASFSSSCSCKLSSSATDIIIDVEESNAKIDSTVEDFELVSEPKLPPILTKPVVKHETSLEKSPKPATKIQARSSTTARKSISRGGRVKIRGNTSARFSGRRSDFRARKSDLKSDQNQKGLFYSDSFAIVKASVDPEKDFRDSMVEMIVENNIRASKDLEDLLACYLSLNANQYHDVIIRAFQQIWFNMCELLS